MKVYYSREIGEIMGLSHQGAIDVLNRSKLGFQLPLSADELEQLKTYYMEEKKDKNI